MLVKGSGSSATKRGAWIGAGIGFVGGTYGGLLLAEGIGCLEPRSTPCNETQSEITAIVVSSVAGTLLGALTGAVVGKVIGVLTPDMSR